MILKYKFIIVLLCSVLLQAIGMHCVFSQETKMPYAAVIATEKLVSFETEDGEQIVGSFFYPKGYNEKDISIGKRYPGVILFHMWRSNRYSWLPLVEKLQEANYSVLCIDFRKHGESSLGEKGNVLSHPDYYIPRMINDAKAAYDFMKNNPIVNNKSISVSGASIGTIVALKLCAKINNESKKYPLRSIVLLSPAEEYFSLSVRRSVRQCKDTAILFILSINDPSEKNNCNFKSGSSLYDRFDGVKEKLVLTGRLHGTKMFNDSQVIPTIIGWFDKYNKSEDKSAAVKPK